MDVDVAVDRRGAGVAIVRYSGRFLGRTFRVGTAWQSWAVCASGQLRFVDHHRLRRDAVAAVLAHHGYPRETL